MVKSVNPDILDTVLVAAVTKCARRPKMMSMYQQMLRDTKKGSQTQNLVKDVLMTANAIKAGAYSDDVDEVEEEDEEDARRTRRTRRTRRRTARRTTTGRRTRRRRGRTRRWTPSALTLKTTEEHLSMALYAIARPHSLDSPPRTQLRRSHYAPCIL